MTDQGAEATELLGSVDEARGRTRRDRHGFWFPLVVFGLLTLFSIPLYWQYAPSLRNIPKGSVTYSIGGTSFPGSGLDPYFWTNGLGRWVTYYWTAALILGYIVTVWFYRRRAARVGISQRVWPTVLIGIGALAFVLWTNDILRPSSSGIFMSGDLWGRGTVSLVILSLGLLTLAISERSAWYVIYSLGFIGLALMSSLYNVSNLFDRLGIGGPFDGNGQELPNLLLPAAYLLLGGIVCWAIQRGTRSLANVDGPVAA
ncbi:MAG: hypothetical protein ABI298_01630 [Acidimicrobiales bacterium]